MSLSDDTNRDIKFFLRVFNQFTGERKEGVDNILTSIKRDIETTEKAIQMLQNKKIKFKLQENVRLTKTDLFNVDVVPSNVKRNIENNNNGIFTLKCKVLNVDVKINLLLMDERDFNRLKFLERKLIYALKMVYFCLMYKNNKRMKSLDVYLYLSNEKKILPESNVTILSLNECNTAVTYACSERGSILIFREEEWKKVLLHELFHSLCLDFSMEKYKDLKNNIKKLYNIKSDFEISETYTEFWATIVNSCYTSYMIMEDKSNISNYLTYAIFFIQMEKVFSLFQCVKILDFMGLRYVNLISNTQIDKSFRDLLYRENTNVFAYYILKMVLLFNVNDFLLFCKRANTNILSFDKTPQNFTKLSNFIKENYKSENILDSLVKMELFYNKFKKGYNGSNKDVISNTMRMTMINLKLK